MTSLVEGDGEMGSGVGGHPKYDTKERDTRERLKLMRPHHH